MNLRLLIFTLPIFWCFTARAQYLSNGTASALVGAYGAVVVHEAGHALTAELLGKHVEIFRPFPSKIRWQLADGRIEERWSLGVVKLASGELNPREAALFAAMGSGANAFSVLLLAPLLPQVSGFGAKALDDYLAIANFELPAYALADFLGLTSGTGDWSQVSQATGAARGWLFVAGVAESLVLNQYRLYWRAKSPAGGTLRPSSAALGMNLKLNF